MVMVRLLLAFLSVTALFVASPARAVSYANQSTPFSWIDASSHTKLSWNSPTYFFSNTGGCGTTQPVIDDTLTNPIPIGFNFLFGGKLMNFVRVMSNGRVHFVSTIETPNIDNTTCGYGSPVTQLPYPNAGLNYTLRIYGNDLDPTRSADVAYTTSCVNGTNCYVSFAQLGSAPYRSFVVTWNNVPEWAAGSTTTGNYNLQLILQENGEFIYQYGTVTQGPGAATAQVGWQVGTTDYDVPQVGFPGTNTALKFFIPGPVAEYRMEQPSWTTAPGQVLDTSGNNRHGTRLGAAQTISGGRVCRGASIPNNTVTTTIDAVDTGINVPATVGSVGTITFWYNSTAAWNSQDAQLFDATVLNNEWFFLVKRSSGKLRFVIRDTTGTNRVVETATSYTFAGNTWKHIAVSWNFNATAGSNQDRMVVYLDGAAVQTLNFTSAGALSNSISTLYVGDNRSAITGQNGTGRSANGIIDEFRIYNYEGGPGLVQRDYAQTQQCLDHYAVSHAGTGQSCNQTQVTITAHDNAHGNIIMPNNTTQISLSTSDGTGDWALQSGYGTLTPVGSNLGTATYLWNGEYQVVLSLTHPATGSISINVTDGQIVEQEDPSLVISACVSGFNACELTSPRCVPPTANYDRLYTKLASTAFVIDVVALQSGGTLATTFGSSVSVDLLVNSATGVALGGNNCPVSQTAVVPLGNVAFTAGRGPAPGVSVGAAAFSSVAPNYSAYRDVRVRLTCSAGNCPPSGLTVCSGDNFAVRPQAFTVSSTNATQAGSSGTPTIKAGAAFNLTAASVAGYNGAPLLDNTKVLGTPVAGTIAGTFTVAPLNTGTAAGAAFTYTEVGNVGLNANAVYDSTYTSVDPVTDCIAGSFSNVLSGGRYGCGIGSTAVPQTTGVSGFGRFIPDHFTLTSMGTLTPACASGAPHTYQGQPFGIATVQLEARRLDDGGETKNYTGVYAKHTPTALAAWSVGACDNCAAAGAGGTALTARVDPGAAVAGVWTNGKLTANFSPIAINRLVANTPDGPFAATRIGVAPFDSDAVTLAAAALNLDADRSGVNERVQIGANAAFRFGRLRLENAAGSQKTAVPVPIRTQYWNGTSFVTNVDDGCTVIPRSAVVLDDWRAPLAACNTFVQQTPNVTFSGGIGTLQFAAPNVTGSVRLTPNLSAVAAGSYCNGAASAGAAAAAMPWLQGRWDASGPAFDDNPPARATFGLYGAQPRTFIFYRENY